MTQFRRIAVVSVAISALCASSPVLAAPSPALQYAARFEGQSDRFVLEQLLGEYRRDPDSLRAALAYIDLYRPAIRDRFLDAISSRPAARRAAATGNFPVLAIAGLGLAAGAAAAFAGGAGGGEQASAPPPPPPPPAPEPLPPGGDEPVQGSADAFRTQEYYANYGLETIGAAVRYSMGAQGQGVKVAVLDTGIDLDNAEFAGRIDTANSYSYFADHGDFSDTGGHGSHVSGIIAAAKNDIGMHGVAFGSELVILKGIPGAAGETPTQGRVWADAINRSVAAGAAVMNNSWTYARLSQDGLSAESVVITDFGSRQELENFLGTSTIQAFDNAAANDLLIVAAAGNDSFGQVSAVAGVPVLLPEYDGYFIAVTATDSSNVIAYYANRCGVAMDFCLAAPGSRIRSVQDGGGTVLMSGTSMATPHVSGAAAVLKSQNPELTSPEIATIMFETATDLGAAGTDPVYGRGLLNLAEARAPQGAMMVYSGTSTLDGKTPLSQSGIVASPAMSAALGTALASRDMMVGDRYDRGYMLSAGDLVLDRDETGPRLTDLTRLSLGDGVTMLSSDSGIGVERAGDGTSYRVWGGDLPEGAISEDLTPLSFVSADFGAEYRVSLGGPVSLDAGFSGASGADGHTAVSLGVSADLERVAVGARFGLLEESGTVLGTEFLGAAGGGGQAHTRYVELRGDLKLSGTTTLSLVGSSSLTDFSQDGLITGGHDLRGAAGRIALSREGLAGLPGTVTASVSSPLRVTSGSLSMDLPMSRVAAEGNMRSTGVLRESTSVAFSSDARPYDFGLGYESEIDAAGSRVSALGGIRADGREAKPFAELNLSLRF